MADNKIKIEDLINVLNKYNDAVIILGDRTDNTKINYNIFNRRTMIKTPKLFWKFYKKEIFDKYMAIKNDEKEQNVNKLIEEGIAKLIINTRCEGSFNNIRNILLRGDINELKCLSCNKKYSTETEEELDTIIAPVMTEEGKEILKCECGGKISPTILTETDAYNEDFIKEIKDAIFKEDKDGLVELNTHALILIDVDTEEDYISELIESFNSIKNNNNVDKENNEKSFLVMICEKDGLNIEAFKPEFATYEDINNSIIRLTHIL